MTVYSHSRISTFENCPYKYKLQYIDKIKVEAPTIIEAFMGDLVHKVLEKLHRDLQLHKINSKQELLSLFKDLWEKGFSEDIIIAKKEYTWKNYFTVGEHCISSYYAHYKPFDDMTVIGLETQDKLTLPDGNKWHVRIDKLGFNGTTYYVSDYKTNSKLKTQEEADLDRQLAMYSLWVKDKFPDAEKIILKWYMLAFDKEIVSQRTEDQLESLQKEIMNLIKKIESTEEFPRKISGLCNYCVYKEICPSFKHELELEEKTAKEFREDDGVKLVNIYAKLMSDKKEIEAGIDKTKNELVGFSQQKGIDIVYGSNKKVSVKEIEKVIYPEEKEAFLELLKEKGLYEENSMICTPKLSSKILKNTIDKEIIEATTKEKDYRLSISKRKVREE